MSIFGVPLKRRLRLPRLLLSMSASSSLTGILSARKKSASELKRVVLPPPPLAPSVKIICLRSACFLSVVLSILGLVFEGFVRVIAQVPFLGFLFLGARLSASACGLNGRKLLIRFLFCPANSRHERSGGQSRRRRRLN